jgi:two-component system, NarL family, nitrate/nitrite response regulator NarL
MPSSTKKPVRILLINNQAVLRAGLRLLVESRPEFKVVGEAGNRADALSIAAREKPDIILLDYDLDCNGCSLDFLPELFSASNDSRLLILTADGDRQAHQCAVRFGAVGVVLKDRNPEELHKAIEKVNAGEVWLDRSLTASVISGISHNQAANHCEAGRIKLALLSERELEVFHLVGDGLRNKDIARQMFISETTVRHHLTAIFNKLEISNRLELVIFRHKYNFSSRPASTPPCQTPESSKGSVSSPPPKAHAPRKGRRVFISLPGHRQASIY